MKARWIYGGILASALSLPAFGQISVTIGTPPPPIRYEARPAMPGNGFVWVDGYWGIRKNRYVWMPGGWQRPPYPGAYWVKPAYNRYNKGWQMQQGHWSNPRKPDARPDDRYDNGRGR
jgi:hypothetical protein